MTIFYIFDLVFKPEFNLLEFHNVFVIVFLFGWKMPLFNP